MILRVWVGGGANMRACVGIAMPRGTFLFITKVIATIYNLSVQVSVSLINFSSHHI